jgi:hypothetical protein
MRVGSGDYPRGLMVCFRSIIGTKPRMSLSSKPGRHQHSDGDCAFWLGTSVVSIQRSGRARQ